MQVSEYMAHQWICEWLITSAIIRAGECLGPATPPQGYPP